MDLRASSLFDQNPFKEFNTAKLKDMLEKKDYIEIVNMRQDAVMFMNKVHQNEMISPRIDNLKRYELESWVSKEKADLKRSKKDTHGDY